MENINCKKGCCTLYVSRYIPKEYNDDYKKYNKKKAGIILFDTDSKSILIVQSRGKYWGFPKGTKNDDETIKECAIRETMEETGINVNPDHLNQEKIINNKATYYFLNFTKCDVIPQTHILDNDANSIGWININCLQNMLKNDDIRFNQQCKRALNKYFI